MNLRHNTFGFTLIEILTVLSVIGVIAATAFPVYAHIRQNAELGNTVDEIAADLHLTRSYAVTAQDGADWNLRFDPTNHAYDICKDTCQPADIVQSQTVDPSIQLPDVTVTFTRLSGETTTQTLPFSRDSQSQSIHISAAGTITIQ